MHPVLAPAFRPVAAARLLLADVAPRAGPVASYSFLLVALVVLIALLWIGVRFARRRSRAARDGETGRRPDA